MMHMIAKVQRLAGLPSISSSVDVPIKFYTLEAESTNNRMKTKNSRELRNGAELKNAKK